MAYFQYPEASGGTGVDTYPTFGDFPATADPGQLAVALDTDQLYVYDSTLSSWLTIGGTAVPLSVGAYNTAAANVRGATIGSNSLYMQGATSTFPGLVSSAEQTFSGSKSFLSSVGVGASAGSGSFRIKANGTNYDSALELESSSGAKLWRLYPDTNGFLYVQSPALTILPFVINNAGRVAIGNGSPDAQLTVGVAEDVVQLTVNANATQTSNLAQYKNTGGAVAAFVSAAGGSVWTSTRAAIGTIGSLSHTQAAGGGAYTVSWPSAQAAVSGQVLSNNASGVLSWQTAIIGSASLTTQVSGSLPLSQTTGSISLTNQVAGALPLGQTSGSISLTSQVEGLLPITQTLGSVSLANKVVGTLPIAFGGTNSAAALAGGLIMVSSAGAVVESSQLASGLFSNPMTTSGDIIVGSGSGVAARFAGNTSNSFSYLSSTGSAGAANFPSWQPSSGPTFTVLTTGSGSYVVPAAVKWLRVRAVGAGGGGGGSSTAGTGDGGSGVAGTQTLFGTSLIAAGGGGGAAAAGGAGGISGTSSFGAASSGFTVFGGPGSGGENAISSANAPSGAPGGATFMGAGGGGGRTGNSGGAAPPNTGGGGGGAGGPTIGLSGSGGGGGGYVEAILRWPLNVSYAFTVGSAGGGGAAGTSGAAGARGSDGLIVIEEYYI